MATTQVKCSECGASLTRQKAVILEDENSGKTSYICQNCAKDIESILTMERK